MIKKWLEVEIAPDIRGRIPMLLISLSFKVSVLEIPGEILRSLSLAQCLLSVHSRYKELCTYSRIGLEDTCYGDLNAMWFG